MRFVFIGASELSLGTARRLIDRGHEVVIVEASKERIEKLSEEMDCSFLHGDGSKPQILREASPKETDLLFCLTDDDQDNIIAGLVGRSLGFDKVVTSIRDAAFGSICHELGLEHTISPNQTISRYLADMATGVDILELSTILKGEARFFTFEVTDEQAGTVADLELPQQARAICRYREDRFELADPDTDLKEGDTLVLITHSDNLPELQERFSAENRKEEAKSGEE